MKTCNLSTVKNTPSEARRDALTVDFYYIKFSDDDVIDIVPRWWTLQGVIGTIWEVLETEDLYILNGLYIYAYMSDGTSRRVRQLFVDIENRHIRICRVD